MLPRLVRACEAAGWLASHRRAKGFAHRLQAALSEAGHPQPAVLLTATVDDHAQPQVCVHIITSGAFTATTLRAADHVGLGEPTATGPPAALAHPPPPCQPLEQTPGSGDPFQAA